MENSTEYVIANEAGIQTHYIDIEKLEEVKAIVAAAQETAAGMTGETNLTPEYYPRHVQGVFTLISLVLDNAYEILCNFEHSEVIAQNGKG